MIWSGAGAQCPRILLSRSPDSIPRERAQNGLRLPIDYAEQHASRAARSPVAALPVSQRARTDSEFDGEFKLRQARLFPDSLDVYVGKTVYAYLCRPPFLVRNGLP